jgi:hypothetical protein
MELPSNKVTIDEEIEGHFLNLYAMALSDLSVAPEELELLYSIGERRGVPGEHIEELLLNPERIEFDVPEDRLTRIEYLYDLALMIWSDGVVDPAEKKLLKKFCLKFGFRSKNVTQIAKFLLEEAKDETSINELLDTVEKNL